MVSTQATRRRFILPITALTLGASLLLALPHARADDQDGMGVPFDAEGAANRWFGHSMVANTRIGAAYKAVKAVLQLDPFAFFEAILGQDGGPMDITVTQARDEILAEMRKEREEGLIGSTTAVLDRLQELFEDPDNMIASDRLANLVDDAADLFDALELIMRNGEESRAEQVYHLAPSYNSVASARVAGLAAASWAPESIDRILASAITTNMQLVSNGVDPYYGYLYNYVVTLPWKDRPWTYSPTQVSCCPEGHCTACNVLTLRCASTPPLTQQQTTEMCHDDVQAEVFARWDSDPTVFLIRRSAAVQLASTVSEN